VTTRRLAAGLAAMASAALVACGDEPARPAPALRPLLDAIVEAGAPGAVGYVRDSRGVRRAAAGLGEIEGRRPMTVDARFRTASVTKSFVAAVVLKLVAEGRLGLDDPARRWLGELPRDITVRHLLRHTSGLADYLDDPAVLARQRREPARAWNPRALVRKAAAQPRSRGRVDYSSTNYLALGLVVEAVTGRRLGDELRRRIFAPLGLRHTTFTPGTRLPDPHAHGYTASVHDGIVGAAVTDRSRDSASWAWAAGAVVSDADDLARFFDALLAGRLLPRRLTAEMVRPLAGRRKAYGLGVAAFPVRCGAAWGHTGNLLGYVTAAYSRPDRSRQVVLMVNTFPHSGAVDRAVRRALDELVCG
jgi:D-alanyl-D-alanine carboxypeptidase